MPTSTAGRLTPNAARNSSGFTLIELMVTMTIVGVIFAVAAVGLRTAFDVNLKNAARQLSATLRYLHNKSVTDHVYFRIVYDFEKRSYGAEESADPFVISRTEEPAAPPAPEGEGTGEAAEGEEAAPKSAFTPSESKLLKNITLPSGVFFKDIQVAYLSEKKESGQAYTYFFPDGFSTETVIHLRDEDDQDHYSVQISPLTGRVKVEGGYLEAEAPREQP